MRIAHRQRSDESHQDHPRVHFKPAFGDPELTFVGPLCADTVAKVETLKREAIDDSDNLSRVTEVAYEFSVRRRGPSDFYTKTAPAPLKLF
jgi:hypothetical protein